MNSDTRAMTDPEAICWTPVPEALTAHLIEEALVYDRAHGSKNSKPGVAGTRALSATRCLKRNP